MVVVAKIFEPLINVWEYTFFSIFFMIALIIWEFSKKTQIEVRQSNERKFSKDRWKKQNHEANNQAKLIDSESIEPESKAKQSRLEDDKTSTNDTIAEKNKISQIFEEVMNNPVNPFRDTEEIIISEEFEEGYFLEGDLPDELLDESLWMEDSIEIIDDEQPTRIDIHEIIRKSNNNIPLDEEEIIAFERYQKLNNPINTQTENIFADYNI